MEIEKISLVHKLGLFNEYWSPRLVGEVNDSAVKLVKLKGEFVWHHHADEDELFLVVLLDSAVLLSKRIITLNTFWLR